MPENKKIIVDIIRENAVRSKIQPDNHTLLPTFKDVVDGAQNKIDQVAGASQGFAELLHKLSPVLDVLKTNFGWIVTICLSVYNIFHALFIREEHDNAGMLSRAAQIVMGLAGIALGVIGIITLFGLIPIALPVLFAISYAKSAFENILHLSHSIYDRFVKRAQLKKEITALKTKLLNSGKALNNDSDDVKELTKLINERNQLNRNVANNAHLVAISIASLIGACLLFTPAAPVGIAIIFGVTAYSCLDALGLNPLRIIARKISQKFKMPFSQRTTADVADKLQKGKSKEMNREAQKEILALPQKTIEPNKIKKRIARRFSEVKANVKTKFTKVKLRSKTLLKFGVFKRIKNASLSKQKEIELKTYKETKSRSL